MTKVYYHVIEEGSYDEIGSHGYYENYEDAKSECERLQEFFPDVYFYEVMLDGKMYMSRDLFVIIGLYQEFVSPTL